MKSTGGRLRGRERAKQGKLWHWIKTRETHTSFTLVGTGQLIVNIEHTEITCSEQDSNERFCGLMLWCGGSALRGKGDYSDIPDACYLRCKRTIDRLNQVHTNLCQGSYGLGCAVTHFQLGILHSDRPVRQLSVSEFLDLLHSPLSSPALVCGLFSVHTFSLSYGCFTALLECGESKGNFKAKQQNQQFYNSCRISFEHR